MSNGWIRQSHNLRHKSSVYLDLCGSAKDTKNNVSNLLKFQNCFMYSDRNDISDHTVKPVYNGHSKIDKTKIFMTNGSLMKVEWIAECPNATL